jgi:glycerate dehydrogenase
MESLMRAVFLDRATIDSSIDLSSINSQLDQLKIYSATQPEKILERTAGFDIVITNKVVLDSALLAQLPQLKLICITATGTNNIDLAAANKQGIAVANVAGYSTPSVSQHVFAYLLNLTNHTADYLALNQTRPWHQSQLFCQFNQPITELAGLNLGIVGYGELGQAVAKIGRAFGMNILIAERNDVEPQDIRNDRVSFEQMLQQSDIISLHCPLTEQTQNLFNQSTMSKMKPGSVLINTARGPIVNSADLVEALKSKHLAHAIIDVLETEPPTAEHPLMQDNIPNLSLSHHIAWGSLQAQQRLIQGVANNIRGFV